MEFIKTSEPLSNFVCYVSRLFVLVFVLAISCPLNAFNATVCDCSEATNVGFLRFPDEECSFQPTEELPQPVEYALFSTIPEVKRFAGHICSMWEATTTVYKDFMQWNTVTNSRKPIPVDDAVCRLMRDTRICRGRPMEVAGNNIFSLGDYPYVEATWLRTATETFMNCRLEEVTLQSECANCTISSPLGDIPGAAKGSFHHNLVTLVWEDTWKETLPCQARLVEAGEGQLYKGDNSTTLRVRDPNKQLDFIYTPATIEVCSTIGNRSTYHAVLGMEQVAITVRILPNKTASTDYVRYIGRDRQGNPVNMTSNLTWAEIEYASHTQYSRDLATELSNHLAKEIRNLQCEQRRTAHQAAISTAQYNGWLAAAYLDLPLCSKLLAVGASATILRCTPNNYTFEPVFTNCGPQPRTGNSTSYSTINSEGWELTKFADCYWHANVVNFNGRAHTFRNNTWAPVNPNIVMHGRRLIDTFQLEVDNSFGPLRELHPAIASHPLSSSKIMADILSYVQMGYSTNLSGDRHVETILVNPREKESISFAARVGNWLKNFGILSGVGMTVALAFRFCGLGTCLGAYIPCLRYCNPFSWLASMPRPTQDIETGREVTRAAAPVTIVNVPPQTRVDTPVRPTVSPSVDVLRRYEPYQNFAQTRHKEAATLLQTHRK